MRTFTDPQRRARLARRHYLSPPANSLVEVANAMVGLHASDPATVFLSARARTKEVTVADIESAMYEERTLLKVLGMRRTMFVVPVDLAPHLDSGCAGPLVPGEVGRLEKMLADGSVTDDPKEWVERVMKETLEAIRRRGPSLATELSQDVPELSTQISFGEGKKWAGTVGLSTRVLFLLATTGQIVRARPRGSWLSSQYRWVATEEWLGAPRAVVSAEEARVALARRWLETFGPATVGDLKWWSGWTLTQTKAALQAVGAVDVTLESGAGIVAPGDLDDVAPPPPAAWFLPALDPTVMGWKERDFYLGDHRSHLFDTNGNAGPTVWWDGRVVGGWGQRTSGEIVYRLLENLGSEANDALEAEAARLQDWLAGTRVIPRFRTPLEKELAT